MPCLGRSTGQALCSSATPWLTTPAAPMCSWTSPMARRQQGSWEPWGTWVQLSQSMKIVKNLCYCDNKSLKSYMNILGTLKEETRSIIPTSHLDISTRNLDRRNSGTGLKRQTDFFQQSILASKMCQSIFTRVSVSGGLCVTALPAARARMMTCSPPRPDWRRTSGDNNNNKFDSH